MFQTSRSRTRASRAPARSSRSSPRRARAGRRKSSASSRPTPTSSPEMPYASTNAPDDDVDRRARCGPRARLTSTCESSGFVSAKSSLPSRTSSISRSMFGWMVVRITPPSRIWIPSHDQQLRLRPPVQLGPCASRRAQARRALSRPTTVDCSTWTKKFARYCSSFIDADAEEEPAEPDARISCPPPSSGARRSARRSRTEPVSAIGPHRPARRARRAARAVDKSPTSASIGK